MRHGPQATKHNINLMRGRSTSVVHTHHGPCYTTQLSSHANISPRTSQARPRHAKIRIRHSRWRCKLFPGLIPGQARFTVADAPVGKPGVGADGAARLKGGVPAVSGGASARCGGMAMGRCAAASDASAAKEVSGAGVPSGGDARLPVLAGAPP